jgi:hypothetical protein
MRDVYLDPKHDRDVFHLSSEQCLKLLRPHYGLADSGDYWHSTFLKHTKSDLEMITTFTDASFFFHLSRAHALNGLIGNYVDYSMQAGNLDFEKHTEKTLATFETRGRTTDNFNFSGIDVATTSPGNFTLSQPRYINRIDLLNRSCTFSEFRSRRAQLHWCTHTRPEISFAVNQAAQVTDKTFKPSDMQLLNRSICRLRENPARGLS